jgi:glycine hydroxymethyltransferase
LRPGETQKTTLTTPERIIKGNLTFLEPDIFRLSVRRRDFGLSATFLRGLSDGYIAFDPQLSRRMPGPIIVCDAPSLKISATTGKGISSEKPYFIGMVARKSKSLPKFTWNDSDFAIKKTKLNELHRQAGAKMVTFAGWDMPVWYTSVVEEHLATRRAAGLFDVSHMGIYQAEGPDACVFLDCVCGNDIAGLAMGESCYTHFLDPEANVIDDLMVYRRADQKYMLVVNAANDDKDWAWLNSVREGRVQVDPVVPWAKAFGRNVTLRNLRDLHEGAEMRVDIALQGPKSRDILVSLGCDSQNRKDINRLKHAELWEGTLGDFDVIVSRTGYTGEKMAFELFVHPERVVEFWKVLLKAGEPFGLKPCGLGARDSLRTEAGLPLYGHEMGGELNLGVADAGFG